MKIIELLENKDYFNTKTTGRPTPDDILFHDPEYHRERKKKTGEIVYMSPDEYIKRAILGFKSIGEPAENVEQTRNPELIDKYAQMMQDGTKFDMPILDYRDGYFSQEGLHRAMAARKLGARDIPVAILKDVT